MAVVLERPVVRSRQPAKAKLTLQEYLALREGSPTYEFEDGELIEMPRPHSRHQKIILRLSHPIDAYLLQRQSGEIWPEIEVILPGQTKVYIPDLVCLLAEHLDQLQTDGRIHDAPDLVVEVLSPATRQRDRTSKMKIYQRAGVKWYWLVEQDDLSLDEFELTDRGYLATQLIPRGTVFQPTLFPGLPINLGELMGEVVHNTDKETP